MRYNLRTLLIVLAFAPPMLALTFAAACPLIRYVGFRPSQNQMTWDEAISQAQAVSSHRVVLTADDPRQMPSPLP